jgi:hypothetical protein
MPYRRILIILMMLTLLTACGTRGIPTISPEMLNSKISVMIITSKSLSDSAKQMIGNKLLEWRSSKQIAFEWAQDNSELDVALLDKLHTRTYDYIIVIGNELLPAATKAASGVKNSKWTLIQDHFDLQLQSPGNADPIMWLQIDPKQVDTLKENWVEQLLMQKVSIEWLTTAEYPIPSLWAPSEEADHIVLLSGNDQWYQQLVYQTRRHASKWIVINSPVDASVIQKAKTVGVNVVDLSTGLSSDLNWETIMNNQLTVLTQHSWKSGVQSFTDQEVKEIKVN